METTKKKRVVTRIGNVFCAEINNEHKRFFQYVANDIEQLNSSVIRVFKNKYPIDYNPNVEDIVKDKIDFYAHTILKFGIEFNAWYKVGTSKTIGEELHIPIKLTTYVARHSYATILKRAGVSISIISESLGHSSERVTQIYLDGFENSQIDRAMKNL